MGGKGGLIWAVSPSPEPSRWLEQEGGQGGLIWAVSPSPEPSGWLEREGWEGWPHLGSVPLP